MPLSGQATHLRVLGAFVEAARDGNCAKAWGLGTAYMHSAYHSKHSFCTRTLPLLAHLDLDAAHVTVLAHAVELQFPGGQSISAATISTRQPRIAQVKLDYPGSKALGPGALQ